MISKSTRIGVLMGGLSSEREVSLETGSAVLRALREEGYDAVGIDVTREIRDQLRENGVEFAFIALHGPFGEDGRLQGLLEYLDIPYTGSGVMASAVAMDKVTTKRLALTANIPTPPFQVIDRDAWLRAGKPGLNALPADESSAFGLEIQDNVCPRLALPCVVKPPLEGSTIGITVVKDETMLRPALELAFSLGGTALLERFIPGTEATVGILNGEALPVIEIVPASGFYDYEAKYKVDDTKYLCPAAIGHDIQTECRDMSLRLYDLLGCKGACRVDFRITEDGTPYMLEINTIPGMTSHSLVPKAAAAVGISFNHLVLRILNGAVVPND